MTSIFFVQSVIGQFSYMNILLMKKPSKSEVKHRSSSNTSIFNLKMSKSMLEGVFYIHRMCSTT